MVLCFEFHLPRIHFDKLLHNTEVTRRLCRLQVTSDVNTPSSHLPKNVTHRTNLSPQKINKLFSLELYHVCVCVCVSLSLCAAGRKIDVNQSNNLLN
jgi:hypothetical protein